MNTATQTLEAPITDTTVSTAAAIISAELETIKDSMMPAEPIAKYLIAKCNQDPAFAALIHISHKTFEKCLNHVETEVKKILNSRNGHIADQVVYDWAEAYYKLDDAESDRINTEKAAAEKLAQAQKAATTEIERAEQEIKRKEAAAKIEADKAAKKEQERLKISENQISLF